MKPERQHRPVLLPSSNFEWLPGSSNPAETHRLARETAWALLDRVRNGCDPQTVERVIRLVTENSDAAQNNIDDIAELWSGAAPISLAGALWRIYLIRRTITTDPEGTAQLFSQGLASTTTIDPVVAGASEPIAPASIARLGDEILHGVFVGDLAIALERASSYCRVMSLGCAQLADEREHIDTAHATQLTTRALRYSKFADELRAAAKHWRDGTIQ